MFLYGGIDFSEEIVYNDLYTLNIGIFYSFIIIIIIIIIIT